MNAVSMLDFRKNAAKILAQVQKDQRMILTYRGKPVARLEPLEKEPLTNDDPFYSLSRISESLTNSQIDDIIYGD